MAEARLTARSEVGAGLARVVFDVSDASCATYTQYGQYCEVTCAGQSGLFALAGPLGETAWEILVRHAGGASEELLSLDIGRDVSVSEARGPGFPVLPGDARDVVVVVAGSAVGAVRAWLDARTRGAHVTRLYLGVRDAHDPPLAADLTRWAHAGVHVTLCASAPAAAGAAHAVRVGYAQHVCAEDLARGLSPDGVILAAGHTALLMDLDKMRGPRPLYGNV